MKRNIKWSRDDKVLCEIKYRKGDNVAFRMAELEKFVVFANGFFKLKNPVVLKWATAKGWMATHQFFECDETGIKYHLIKMSKLSCNCSNTVIGTLVHELIHAKQEETNCLDIDLFHNAAFWDYVEKAALWFKINKLDIASRSADIT